MQNKKDIELKMERDKEVFKNTCGKKVRITYVPYKFIDELSNPQIYRTAVGTIENMTYSNIYIINDDGCFEMFRLRQVLEMIQVQP